MADRDLDAYLIWAMILIVIEMGFLWAVASQVSYIFSALGPFEFAHYLTLFFLLGISTFLAITIGLASSRSHERWGNQNCKTIFGRNMRFLYKGEVFIIFSVVLGTLVGIGSWTFITLINALIDNNWNLIVITHDYLFFDMWLFQIVLPLWMHIFIGGISFSIAVVLIAHICHSIAQETFCEV